MMTRLFLSIILSALLIAETQAAASYDGYRWFKVEVSIFTNEYPEDINSEHWSAERLKLAYPDNVTGFRALGDFLEIEEFESKVPGVIDINSLQGSSPLENDAANLTEQQIYLSQIGPTQPGSNAGIKIPDLEREPYYLLPESQSDFQTTNQRLQRSPTNRLLFHGLWRQPVVGEDRAQPLFVRGGRQYGQHHELEGSITIRFNDNEDRVVIDTNLWLSEFNTSPATQTPWVIPDIPAGVNSGESTGGADTDQAVPGSGLTVSKIVHMQQSREMRSTEFHYLDHPSLGVVISVLPYDLPPAAGTDYLENSANPTDQDLLTDPTEVGI